MPEFVLLLHRNVPLEKDLQQGCWAAPRSTQMTPIPMGTSLCSTSPKTPRAAQGRQKALKSN